MNKNEWTNPKNITGGNWTRSTVNSYDFGMWLDGTTSVAWEPESHNEAVEFVIYDGLRKLHDAD